MEHTIYIHTLDMQTSDLLAVLSNYFGCKVTRLNMMEYLKRKGVKLVIRQFFANQKTTVLPKRIFQRYDTSRVHMFLKMFINGSVDFRLIHGSEMKGDLEILFKVSYPMRDWIIENPQIFIEE